MARQVFTFDVTVPTGTAKASPQVSNLLNAVRTVRKVVVRVPPGPRGEVGFFIGVNGAPVIPSQVGNFIVDDDQELSWDTEAYPDSGQWELHVYNTGKFSHTLYVRMETDPIGSQAGTTPSPQPLTQAQTGGPIPPPAAPTPPPPTAPPPPLPPPPPLTAPGGPPGPPPVEQGATGFPGPPGGSQPL